jgi:hypothetical protein
MMASRARALVPVAAIVVGGICAAMNVASALHYGTASIGDPRRAPLADVAGLSQHHFISQLEGLQRTKVPGGDIIVSDASSTTVGKLEQSYSFPVPIFFFGGAFSRYDYRGDDAGPLGDFTLGSRSYRSRLRELIKAHTELYRWRSFPGPSGAEFDRFLLDERIPPALAVPQRPWMMLSPDPTLLNTRKAAKSYDVALVPFAGVRNHLVLVPSLRGSVGIFDRRARSGFSPRVMVSRLEPDPLIRGAQIEAVGRYLLLEVVHPSPTVRLVVDFTATLNADGFCRVPPISVVGARRYPFAVTGRGAGRLVSPPLTPRVVDGQPMLEIDMGVDGKRFPEHRTGLLALFGNQYRLDPRLLVGFVRDVSVISEADYQRFTPPAAIARFPRDLRNPSLEYSGFYEDGWVSERAVAWLAAPRDHRSTLLVRGLLPELPGVTDSVIHVKVDGVEVVSQPIVAGQFEVRAAANQDGRRHKVELAFDRPFRLPNGDDRIAAALLSYVGYE